jgi:FkbM family methyltransferase
LEPMVDSLAESLPSMENTLKRVARRLLLKTPSIYRRILKAAGRGSSEKKLYLSIVRPGDVVIDIGADYGDLTMLFADLTGKRGQVHAFEPVPTNFQGLSENIRQFPTYHGVHLNQAAVGDVKQKTTILYPRDNHSQAALIRHSDGSWKDAGDQVKSFEVEMIRLDDYAANLNRVDFIKCDVEGAELLVLRGAESTLRRCRPIICLEIDERWLKAFGWSSAEVFQFLRQIGYTYFYNVSPAMTPVVGDSFPGRNLLCCWKELGGLG